MLNKSHIPELNSHPKVDGVIASPNVDDLRKALDQLAQDVNRLNGAVRTITVQPGKVQTGNNTLPPGIPEICLNGNWPANAGFTNNDPVRVISMDRILIILPIS
jgi:hypothetical protein